MVTHSESQFLDDDPEEGNDGESSSSSDSSGDDDDDDDDNEDDDGDDNEDDNEDDVVDDDNDGDGKPCVMVIIYFSKSVKNVEALYAYIAGNLCFHLAFYLHHLILCIKSY